MKKIPTVGISYSWKDNDVRHKEKVKLLAEKLTKNDIKVNADFNDYEPTHDLYYFMELLVHENDYILFICEPSSKIKADTYKGQLGAQEVPHLRPFLSDPKQEKVIPIIFEKDSNGNPIKPRFLELAYGIDLSEDDSFESETFYYLVDFLKGIRNVKPSISNIQDFSNSNHQGLPEIHNIKQRRIKSFITKRTKNVILQIANYLDTNKHKDYSEIKPITLISTSGEGKSTAIIEFCYNYGKQFDYIFMIDCNSNIKDQLHQLGSSEYLKLYTENSKLKDEEKDENINKVIDFFNKNNCLIYFDDFNTYQEIVNFLPKHGRSRVLLSTTNFTLKHGKEIDIIDFPYLETDDAYNILVSSNYQNKISESEKVKYYELCDFLNNMPFALRIANEYIEEYFEMGIEFFLNELKESSVKWEGLLSQDISRNINESYSVIALIEKKIVSIGKNVKIIEMLSFIGIAKISEVDFTFTDFQELMNLEKKEFIVMKNELSKKGIVDLSDNSFIVHNLFIEYFIQFLCNNEQKIIFGEFLSSKCNKMKDLMFQLGSWVIYDKERKGLKLICDNIVKSKTDFNTDKLVSLYSCAWSHYDLEDDYSNALDSINSALSISEEDLNVNTIFFNQRKYALLFQKAITIHKNENYPDAESLYIEILKKRNFVSNHIIINSVFYCGHIARLNRKNDDAIIWYEDGIEITKKVLLEYKDDKTKDEAGLLLLRGYNYLKSIYVENGNQFMIQKYEIEIEKYKPFAIGIDLGVQMYLDYIYRDILKPSSNLGLKILLVDNNGNFKYF